MKQYIRENERYKEMCRKHQMSPGMFGHEDLDCLLTYAEKIPGGGVYAEIGIANGSSLMAVAQFRPDVQCFGIEVNKLCKADKNIIKEGLENVIIMFGKSEEVCKTWEKDIDMLFIDGDHYFPYIYWDIVGWMPFVKREGYILFHDYEKPEEARYDVGKAVQVFRNHPKYECKIPSIDEVISTSMAVIRRV